MHKTAGIAAAITVAVIGYPAAANAEFYTGARLVEFMRYWERAERDAQPTVSTLINATRFSAYVTGVHDALAGVVICAPTQTTTIDTIVAVAAQYLNDHPEEWPQSADRLVARALARAFPCPKVQ